MNKELVAPPNLEEKKKRFKYREVPGGFCITYIKAYAWEFCQLLSYLLRVNYTHFDTFSNADEFTGKALFECIRYEKPFPFRTSRLGDVCTEYCVRHNVRYGLFCEAYLSVGMFSKYECMRCIADETLEKLTEVTDVWPQERLVREVSTELSKTP